MFKKAMLISTLALSFGFFGCSSEEDTIKSLALEQCKKYAELRTNANKPYFEKVLNIEIAEVKQNNNMKSAPQAENFKWAECRIKAVLASDRYDFAGKLQKKGSEAEIEVTISVDKVNGEWEAKLPNR